MYHKNNCHSIPLENEDLFKSFKKFKGAVLEKNQHFPQ